MQIGLLFQSQQIYNSTSSQLHNLALKATYSRQQSLSYLCKRSGSILHTSLVFIHSSEVFHTLQIIYNKHLKLCLTQNKICNLINNDQFLKLNYTQNIIQINQPLCLLHRHIQSDTPQTNYINLSNNKPTTEEQTVLSKGLSFCQPPNLDPVDLCYDLDNFLRNIKLREYFSTTNHEPSTTQDKTYTKSCKLIHWSPPNKCNNHIDSYTKRVRNHLDKFIQNNLHLKHSNNFTRQEWLAIKILPS